MLVSVRVRGYLCLHVKSTTGLSLSSALVVNLDISICVCSQEPPSTKGFVLVHIPDANCHES
jgi:hypothetical protein